MNKQRLRAIIEKILAGNATAAEVAEISDAIQQDHVRQVVEDIHGMLSRPENEKFLYDEEKWAAISEKILKSDEVTEEAGTVNKVIGFFTRIPVAVAVVVALALGICFFVAKRDRPVVAESPVQPVWNDIAAPARINAVLTLSDGKEIELENMQPGLVSQEANMNVLKLPNGGIVYHPATAAQSEEMPYHTLTVPKGSKLITVKLADGTKVWLNNESSLRYPTAFTGDDRKVEVTGEAYFEVAKNPGKPFFVTSGETMIKVIGTQFNLNAYSDQPLLRVTVLEGNVHVIKGAAAIALEPGQQALVNERIKVTNCDIEQVIAWKNGRFAFQDADIKTVMDQLARWYDLDVQFAGKISKKFQVDMTRDCDVSNVFKALESSGEVQFKFDNKKIYVTP